MDNTQNNPAKPVELTPEQIAWLSDCIIVTCTEGGVYTREDYKSWHKYKHSGKDSRASVTLVPNDDCEVAPDTYKLLVHDEVINEHVIVVTPEFLAARFTRLLVDEISGQGKAGKVWVGPLAKALAADEDFIPDVVEAGAMLQLAVYGEVVYG